MIGRDDDVIDLYYFTNTVSPRGSVKHDTIKAWAYDEELAKAYNKFHKSSNLHFKQYTGTVGEIAELLERYGECEIQINRLKTRDPKKPDRFITLWVPGTINEFRVISSHVKSACTDMVHRYGEIQNMFYRLKDKYKDALRLLYFEEFMRCANMQPSIIPAKVSFDEVRLLIYDNPDHFGQ